MRIFEIAGDSSISPFWPAGALRISAFSLLWTVSLVLVILFHFLFCSSCGTMELGWVQQLLLFAPVGCSGQWSRGKEGGVSREGGIGERQTCTGRISVTCSEQINSATTNDGEEKKRKRKMGKINKTDGRLFEPNNQGALRQPASSSALRTPLTFSTTSHRVRRTSRATSMQAAC